MYIHTYIYIYTRKKLHKIHSVQIRYVSLPRPLTGTLNGLETTTQRKIKHNHAPNEPLCLRVRLGRCAMGSLFQTRLPGGLWMRGLCN